MKNKKQTIKKITDFLEQIDWMFELNNFDCGIKVIDIQPGGESDLTAEVITDLVYREMTIKLYPHFWEISLDLQRKALLHELTHTLLQNTKMIAMDLISGKAHNEEEVKKENEIVVSKVTHLLDCLMLGRLKYARRAYKNYLKK